MDNRKTLHELCNLLGVSRRAVQGYEKAGLVAPSDRNKYGYLLYDEKALNRIARIRLYQQLGFTIREIKDLIDAPDVVVKGALERQIFYLRDQRKQIDALIEIACDIIKAT
uniref:MerR family transcriptional regulator n=1 Tax=Agathobacter sp. TaxID=2021311 RepID=UPI004056AA5B